MLGGHLADKYGRRDLIVVMTFGVALSYVFYAIAPDWRLVALGMALGNLCLIYQPALEAITADSIPPEKRGLGYALANVLPSVPAVFSPLLARELIRRLGFVEGMRIAYWIVVAGSLAAALIRALFLKETLERHEKARLRELLGEFKRSLSEMASAWRAMPRQLKIFTVILFISVFEEPMFRMFMSLYVVHVVGISRADWAVLGVVWSATALAAGIPLGKAVDVVGRKKALVLSYVLWLPSTVYFLLCRSFWELVFIFVLFSLGGSLFGPAHQALIADLTPKEVRGRVMGAIGNLNLGAAAITSALAGLLYELGPAWPFITCVFIDALVLSMILLLLEEPEKREA
ncbi:hypothetical protein DRO33_05150 [Candidatus Bathyarchaeota archaeon]|nr:MAG: hypothetical protein DRO33_05150 [Candidatus Bathyarchaeota archaeon]